MKCIYYKQTIALLGDVYGQLTNHSMALITAVPSVRRQRPIWRRRTRRRRRRRSLRAQASMPASFNHFTIW